MSQIFRNFPSCAASVSSRANPRSFSKSAHWAPNNSIKESEFFITLSDVAILLLDQLTRAESKLREKPDELSGGLAAENPAFVSHASLTGASNPAARRIIAA